ncbi:ArsR family transcriptional regulator [Cryptosporangium sp. NPDC048952]|uniref:ArsR family transcriptional regulator n=1 Tax=Cryptosporangium sp. NPDC048952 TaxID=3363961 RepID=UPI0037225697
MSQPAISKHLTVLENAGLISRTRRATASSSPDWRPAPASPTSASRSCSPNCSNTVGVWRNDS